MSAHALCRCGEAGGTAHCPVHGQKNLAPTRTVSVSTTEQGLPSIRCSACGLPLSARWEYGTTVGHGGLEIDPHTCSEQE
jgi:hypothetical protein